MIGLALALVLVLAPLACAPGPGSRYFAAGGARCAFRARAPATLGHHAATPVVTILIGLGFGRIPRAAPPSLVPIRYAGAAHVPRLAWGLARAGVLSDEVDARPAGFAGGVVPLPPNPEAHLVVAPVFTRLAGVPWIAAVLKRADAVRSPSARPRATA